MSSSNNPVVADSSLKDDLIQRLLALGSARYCACCFGDVELQRCGRCRLVYYCGVDCQKANWKLHSAICNRPSAQQDWIQSFLQFTTDFASEIEIPNAERKAIIGSLKLLEPWAKGIIISLGLLNAMVDVILKEKYTTFCYSLVALVDVLRQPNAPEIDVDPCIALVCVTNGLNVILEVLANHAQLNAGQKLSTLRFLRLLSANPKIQPLLRDQMQELLPLISNAVHNARSIEVASEMGIALSSILYSAESPEEHRHLQSLYVESLELHLWMSCAFGESPWSADMDMGAVEVLLALLIDVDLFPDYEEHLQHNIIENWILKSEHLLKHVVFGLLDMTVVPKDVFQAAAIHALCILMSHPTVAEEVMINLWLMNDMEDDDDDTPSDNSPLRELVKLFQAEPIVQLNFFRTHTHSNILQILLIFLKSRFCNKSCIEAAAGSTFLLNNLEYLKKRYHNGLQSALKWRQSHGVLSRGRVGNEAEMESILAMIAEAKKLIENAPNDILLE